MEIANTNLKTLSENIGINHNYLKSLIFNSDKYYYSYYIDKRSGKKRVIDAPNYEIKAIQSWILRNILEDIKISERANGFVKKRGIKNNARFHLGKAFIMCIDLRDFFPSIKIEQVRIVFLDHLGGDSGEIAEKLAKICTFKGYLPQGAVTSPALSNIIFRPVDIELEKLCNGLNVNYSRYADDLAFSSNDIQRLKDIERTVEDIISKHGFTLNNEKTRYSSGKGRKVVTGIILNSDRMTIGRGRKRLIRSMIHNYIVKKSDDLNKNQLFGYIAFLRDIEPSYFEEKIIPYKRRLMEKFGTPDST